MLTGNKDPLLCRVGMLCRVLLLSFGRGVFKKFTQSSDNEICIEKKSNYGKNPYQMVSQTKHPQTTVWFWGLRERMAPSKPVNKCLLFLEHTVPYLLYRDIPLLLRNVSVGAYGVPFLAFLYWSQFRLIFLSVCALFP